MSANICANCLQRFSGSHDRAQHLAACNGNDGETVKATRAIARRQWETGAPDPSWDRVL
jgi:hypothetical protein